MGYGVPADRQAGPEKFAQVYPGCHIHGRPTRSGHYRWVISGPTPETALVQRTRSTQRLEGCDPARKRSTTICCEIFQCRQKENGVYTSTGKGSRIVT